MHSLLMTAWLCLPLAPLNPIEEDTLASVNLHVAAGVAGPNGIVSVGPIASTSLEVLVVHPFMVRATADLAYGRIKSNLFPRGDLWTTTFGGDAIYYRGTDHLTGYVGAGMFYATHFFSPSDATADSLNTTEGVTDVDLQQEWGYRIIIGIRYHRCYSLEITMTELTPDFRKTARDESGGGYRTYQETRTGSFRVSLGYLFEI
jgi:hypothetical protein